MKREVEGFEIFQAKRRLKGRQDWEKMKKRGFVLHLAMIIAIFIGAFALVEWVHFLCFKFGWLNVPFFTSWVDDIFIALGVGGSIGWISWSDMKRKFDTLPPGEDWTMK